MAAKAARGRKAASGVRRREPPMIIVPEEACPGLLSLDDAFPAVEQVFAAMARGDAYNFPVVREAIGHADALYGFKGGFDRAGADPRRQGRRLLAAQPRARPRRQPPVDGLPLRPRDRQAHRDGRRQLPDRRPHRRLRRRLDQAPRPQGRQGPRHGRRRPPVRLPDARRRPPARLREGDRLEPPPRDALPPRRHRRRPRPAVRGGRPRPPRRRGRRHHHHHLDASPRS